MNEVLSDDEQSLPVLSFFLLLGLLIVLVTTYFLVSPHVERESNLLSNPFFFNQSKVGL